MSFLFSSLFSRVSKATSGFPDLFLFFSLFSSLLLSFSCLLVLCQLLTELDGMQSRRNVFVIAATNRPDIIDPAMLRPGRLDKLLYVGLPGVEDRKAILRTLARKCPLADDVSLDDIASDPRCEGYSGADVDALLRDATIQALKTSTGGEQVLVHFHHFQSALQRITPSVSVRHQKRYLRLKDKLSHSRISIGVENGEGTANGEHEEDESSEQENDGAGGSSSGATPSE